MLLKPVVLKIFTTFAPRAHCCTRSPPEPCAWSSPARFGSSGLVASSTTLRSRLPHAAIACPVAGQGVARTTTSPHCAASRFDSRLPKRTSCPAFFHPVSSARPTFPAPMIAMRMSVLSFHPYDSSHVDGRQGLQLAAGRGVRGLRPHHLAALRRGALGGGIRDRLRAGFSLAAAGVSRARVPRGGYDAGPQPRGGDRADDPHHRFHGARGERAV